MKRTTKSAPQNRVAGTGWGGLFQKAKTTTARTGGIKIRGPVPEHIKRK